MFTRLQTATAACIAVSAAVNTTLLLGGLYLAGQWTWLHPAAATTAAIPVGLGLSLAFAAVSWRWIDRSEPNGDAAR